MDIIKSFNQYFDRYVAPLEDVFDKQDAFEDALHDWSHELARQKFTVSQFNRVFNQLAQGWRVEKCSVAALGFDGYIYAGDNGFSLKSNLYIELLFSPGRAEDDSHYFEAGFIPPCIFKAVGEKLFDHLYPYSFSFDEAL